jgi:hypothetical protein
MLLNSTLYSQEVKKSISKKSLDISRVTGSIKLDGQLSDTGWKTVKRISDFTECQPGDQIEPLVKTEAMLTYDNDNLYVAIVCHDDPAEIRASFCERERFFGKDDNVGFFLDTYGNAAWGYTFNVNPFGIQADALFSAGQGEDPSFDLVWESAATITDSGYQIELAIPFKALRFPNKNEQVWKFDFFRHHPRDANHGYAFAPYDRDESCWACQWSTLTGISDVKQGKGLDIIGSAVGYESSSIIEDKISGGNIPYDYINPNVELSIGGKYSISSNTTIEATYNPDFSQIEADATQIDVNSVEALFFEEKRPFFQEGSDLFAIPMNLVYTRTINDPLFAAKLIGRIGRTSIAYLGAYDEHTPLIVPFEKQSYRFMAGKSFSNIIRMRRAFGNNSRVGLLVTDRRLEDGGSGSVISLDGNIRLTKSLNYTLLMIGTYIEEPSDSMITDRIVNDIENGRITATFDKNKYTRYYDGESFWGHGFYTGISHESSNLFMNLTYLETTPTYRTDNGYRSKNDQRGPRFHGQYTFRFDEKNRLFVSITPVIRLGREWNFDGEKNYEFLEAEVDVHFKAQTSMHASYMPETIKFRDSLFEGLYILHNCFHTSFAEMISFGGYINYGHRIAYSYMVKGREISWGAWMDFKPLDQLLIETSFRHLKSTSFEDNRLTNPILPETLYKDFTLWNRINYQFSRKLSLRMVIQYDDFYKTWAVDPLVTYRVNPFSVLYIGSSYKYCDYNGFRDSGGTEIRDMSWELSSRQFFMKFQYLFQI